MSKQMTSSLFQSSFRTVAVDAPASLFPSGTHYEKVIYMCCINIYTGHLNTYIKIR